MALRKPASRDDIVPGFDVRGPWLAAVREQLEAYGVPIPKPDTDHDLAEAERRIGVSLPPDWRSLLSTLGALELDGVAFLPACSIDRAESLWFKAHLGTRDRARVRSMVFVAHTGSDDYFLWDPDSGRVHLASHDPGGLFHAIPSVADLLRWILVGLPAGYYGWPDDDVAELAEQSQAALLKEWESSLRAG